MVRPVSPAERAAFTGKVRVVVTLLVGASAGLVALGAGATLGQAGVAVLAGLPVGAAIAWWVGSIGGSPAGRQGRVTEDRRGEHKRAPDGDAEEAAHRGTDDPDARQKRR